jgi:hypothetical protein
MIVQRAVQPFSDPWMEQEAGFAESAATRPWSTADRATTKATAPARARRGYQATRWSNSKSGSSWGSVRSLTASRHSRTDDRLAAVGQLRT